MNATITVLPMSKVINRDPNGLTRHQVFLGGGKIYDATILQHNLLMELPGQSDYFMPTVNYTAME